MKYERLTAQGDDVSFYDRTIEECERDYYRLKELEDRIENGTLVELPCKVDDMVYAKSGFTDRIFHGHLVSIELDRFGFIYLVYDNENQQYYQCREVFLTKA